MAQLPSNMHDDYGNEPNETTESSEPPAPIFVLVPVNSAARKATENLLNRYYQYLDEDGSPTGLWINLSDSENPIITLGRAGTNIHLPDTSTRGWPQISDLHASFEFIPETGAVLLRDHSEHQNVEPFAPTHASSWTVKFRSNSRRSVLVARGINSHVGFGKDKWYQFEIRWQSEVMYGFPKDQPYNVGPWHSRTKRYVQLNKLGGGAYGEVYSALDVTTGLLIAVKRFNTLSGKYLSFATREVANLRKEELRRHPHILRILDAVGNDQWGEIFMPLQSGNLKDLIVTTRDIKIHWDLSDLVLRQMLLALECLDANKIIHRDVKPDNILWDLDRNGHYTFCLADFGLSNDPEVAITTAGTAPFMAPEVFYRWKQTTKIDIWSLYATIVWTRDGNFRAVCSSITAHELHKLLTDMSKLEGFAKVRRMAAWNPKHRPTPTQQLHILDQADYEDDCDDTEGYAPAEVANPDDDDLTSRFSRSMSIGESSEPSLTGGSGSSEYPPSLEVPFYEPYSPKVYWPRRGMGRSHEGEGSQRYYATPPMGSQATPRTDEAYVAAYSDTYGPMPSEATAVPSMATAIPDHAAAIREEGAGDLDPEGQGFFEQGHGGYPDYEEYLEERREQKGKNRSYM